MGEGTSPGYPTLNLTMPIVELEIVDGISHETVRQTLKKRTEAMAEGTVLPAGRGSGEFVYHMEHVLGSTLGRICR